MHRRHEDRYRYRSVLYSINTVQYYSTPPQYNTVLLHPTSHSLSHHITTSRCPTWFQFTLHFYSSIRTYVKMLSISCFNTVLHFHAHFLALFTYCLPARPPPTVVHSFCSQRSLLRFLISLSAQSFFVLIFRSIFRYCTVQSSTNLVWASLSYGPDFYLDTAISTCPHVVRQMRDGHLLLYSTLAVDICLYCAVYDGAWGDSSHNRNRYPATTASSPLPLGPAHRAHARSIPLPIALAHSPDLSVTIIHWFVRAILLDFSSLLPPPLFWLFSFNLIIRNLSNLCRATF